MTGSRRARPVHPDPFAVALLREGSMLPSEFALDSEARRRRDTASRQLARTEARSMHRQ